MPGVPIPLAEIDRAIPELRADLSRFRPDDLLPKLGGLLTVPNLHANTGRLEVIIHLAFRHSRGTKRANRRALERLVNGHVAGTPLAKLEDPVEDVFVTNVVSPVGNHRVFEGIWESADYWLQDVIRVISDPENPAWMQAVRRSVRALLVMSEAVAGRLNLKRFAMGGGIPKGLIALPPDDEIARRARALSFSTEHLSGLGIIPEELDPFIAVPGSDRGPQAISNSYLERHPVLALGGGGRVLVLPTGVSAAVRRFVVESFSRHGELAVFERSLRSLQASRAFNHALGRLEGEIVELPNAPSKPASLSLIDDLYCTFDRGLRAHVVLIHGDSRGLLDHGLAGPALVPSPAEADLDRYLQDCARHVVGLPDHRGGLTVLLIGGLGRGLACRLSPLPTDWGRVVLPIPDWLEFCWHEHGSILTLWKLKRQKRRAKEFGVEVFNVNGDLNEFAYWSSAGFRLVPGDFPLADGSVGSVHLATDFVAKYRQTLRAKHDHHAALRGNPDRWFEVDRLMLDSFFAEGRNVPIFASAESAQFGEILGLVETRRRAWWVRCVRPEHSWQRQLFYQIWDGLLSWLVRLAPLLEKEYPTLPSGPIDIEISHHGFENFAEPDVLNYGGADRMPKYSASSGRSAIDLSLSPGFLVLLNQPSNAGERSLLEAIARAGASLAGVDLTAQDAYLLVERVVGSDSARFLHVIAAETPREVLSHAPLPEPRMISSLDSADASLGLARLSARTDNREITGKSECTTFLHALVEGIWQEVRRALAELSLAPLVHRCLENLEALHRDADRWRLTAQALLGIYSRPDDVLAGGRARDSDRSRAQIAYRALIEMAVCTSKAGDGLVAGEQDLDWLAARISLLIDAASASDAIHSGLADARVRISPGLDVVTDRRFHGEIVVPYARGFFEEQFRGAAAAYADHFEQREEVTGTIEEAVDPQFAGAFLAEYRLSLSDFVTGVSTLESLAVERNAAVCEVDRQVAETLLVRNGLDSDRATAFVRMLLLPKRARWDEYPPTGFSQRDWYPWRFGRRLSCVARPLTPTGRGSETFAFGIAGLDESARYVVDRSASGQLNEDFFATPEMRSWIGTANDRLGNAFTTQVGEVLARRGWTTRRLVQMREFGAPERLGDVDVLAWSPTRGTVLAIECKRLRPARTISEIGEQLKRFQGDADDQLGRHIARGQWLRENNGILASHLGLAQVRLRSLLVTNTVVPLQFVKSLPVSRKDVLTINEVEELSP
jgi:hypothetical protein